MLSQSAPEMSVTRPSCSKNLLGTWNIASISPPSGVQATWRLPASRQTNSPGPTLRPGRRAFLIDELAFEHVGLLDLDVLVVGQHGAGRKPHQRGDEASLLVEQKTLHLAAGKSRLLPFHVGGAHDVRMGLKRIVRRFRRDRVHNASSYSPASLIGGWKASPVSQGK